ncbi:MAG TPA: gliding motility-associated C-terminal domain-containing protein, partial [Bacteroidia bacterium]|nr:gliding motility-associated C-terminal domain-containing protein [Bacteroidia bacterium]
LFTYRFAVIINDGGHAVGEQPAFTFQLKDSNGNPVGGICGLYDIDATAAVNDTSYKKTTSSCINAGTPFTYYRKWHTVSLDLSTYVGQTITAEFQTLDCVWGGHFCYAYVSANCGALSAHVSGFCGGSGSVVMTAPGGFANYQWYGPNNNVPITGATASSYTAASAVNGDVFTVNCITLQGCTTKLQVTVSASNIVAQGAATPSCRGGNNGSASVTVTGGTQFTYSWTPGPGTGTSITNQPPGNYSVTIHDISSAHCPDTTIALNIGQINPPLQNAVDTLCGTYVVLSAPATSPYTWYNNSNTVIPGATSQSYTVNPGSGGQHYTVTYKDPVTGCLDSLRKTLNAVTISFNPVSSPPCNGGSNGSITVTSNSGNTFPNYDWTMTGPVNGSGMNLSMPPNVIQASNLPGGTYAISVHPSGNTTCTYTMSVTLQQGQLPPPVLDTLKGCALDHVSVPTTTVSGSTHNWYGSGGTSLGSSYPYLTTGVTNGAVYTDTIFSAAGCKSVYKAYLKLKSFKVTVASPEKIHCHNDSTGKIKVTANQEINGPLGTPYTFTWHYPSPYASPAPINAGAGVPQSTQESGLHQGTYTCTVTSGNCVATATYNLANPALLPYDSLYSYFCPKDSVTWLFTSPGHSGYTWLHNGVPVSPPHNNDSILVTPATIGNYWAVYKVGGCLDTARILFTYPSFHAFRPDKIVNIFTPNGDNRNDFFYPFYDANVTPYQIDKQMEEFTIVIYNRWGKKVFETNEYAKPWNGKDENGVVQDDGTYYWICHYKSNCSTKADIIDKHGFVQLLK